MIIAKDCKDGLYGPVIIAARLRVEGGVVTIVDADDLHVHTLTMSPNGQSFNLDTRATGRNDAPRIAPLPEPAS